MNTPFCVLSPKVEFELCLAGCGTLWLKVFFCVLSKLNSGSAHHARSRQYWCALSVPSPIDLPARWRLQCFNAISNPAGNMHFAALLSRSEGAGCMIEARSLAGAFLHWVCEQRFSRSGSVPAVEFSTGPTFQRIFDQNRLCLPWQAYKSARHLLSNQDPCSSRDSGRDHR